MQDYEVSIQVLLWLGWKKREEIEFEFHAKPNLYFNLRHGELLFKYCSSYSDTGGVTTLFDLPSGGAEGGYQWEVQTPDGWTSY
jgi:hypothetical protein